MKTIEEEFPPEREILYSWELEEKYEALRARAVEMERALDDLCAEVEDGQYDEDPRDLIASAKRARKIASARP